MPGTSEFFEEPTEQSRIKSRVVTKYFKAWSTVMASKGHSGRIAYIDLFAGPGKYEDGTPSTPIILLQMAINDPKLRKSLVTLFNDKNPENAQLLRHNISAIPGIDELKYQPQIKADEVGNKIVDEFQKKHLVPTLLFADPWGYKGVSVGLIGSVLKDWGCDCVVFFNYNRINAGLNNVAVREHMNGLFGEERTDAIRQKLVALNPNERETLIIEELAEALKESGGKYVLPFTFKNEQGTRTKQHLIFVSKHFKGYEIMKEIMSKESSDTDQGVPSFIYNPVSSKFPTLFELSRPLDDLEDMLIAEFTGQKLSALQIYEQHSVGRPYIKSNYKQVLANMEAASKIQAEPPADKRRKRGGKVTFADSVVVTFPKGVQT